MKYMLAILALILPACSSAFAQDTVSTNMVYQGAASGVVTAAAVSRGTPVTGAPYSATITNESMQTLADGTHIVQSNTGSTARDSQGRTRQDAALPTIGVMSAADAPHLVFIMDPVAQTSYTLNLTDKTAQKMPMPSNGAAGPSGGPGTTRVFVSRMGVAPGGAPPPMPPPSIIMQKDLADEQSQVSAEDLGTETMEGLTVTGVRTTRTIPEGQIGNDKPISIVTEVWTSPDLKTIVYSKRTDPRMGEQTFKLTNVVRAEPDASLFTVPSDFKILDGPQNVIYRSNQ
ncbi:MAG: hypothetical protein WAK48_33310 [Candidatus Acidiferrum sp.]|jgi:hypothetical protein